MGGRVEFHILGPLRVIVDGAEVPISARRQRALLVLLALSAGRVVPAERLIDQLWDGAPPPQGAVTLRSYVSNVRQALGGPTGSGSVLATRGQGYCLQVPPDCVDAVRLAVGAQEAREHLRRDRPGEALTAFDAALSTWTGDPLADVADHEAVRSSITQLTEAYLGAAEGRFEALLALGRHADALPGLEVLVADHPLREEPRVLLMLALYRAGRAAEALEVHRAFRAVLQNELGIDPSARIDDLHQRILEQDPTLAPPMLAHETTGYESHAQDASGTDPMDLGPVVAARAVIAPGPTQFVVGRRREQAFLDAHLDALDTGGTGALLLVAGEPGIGKTTLLDLLERKARARGVPVHIGRSPAASGAPAFWLWSQVVDSIAAGLNEAELRRACSGSARPVAQLSTAVADRTAHPEAMLGDNPTTLRFLLYEAVASFIRQAGNGEPEVIILDDLHWADLSSLELLSYLTPSLVTQRILIAAAYRDLPTERSDALNATLATVSREDVVHELRLSGLTREDIAALANELLDDVAEPTDRDEFIAALHDRTGGNPFFLRQLIRLFRETQPGTSNPAALPIPPGVSHVVGSRLARLPAPVEAFLAAAAVIGRDFDVKTAAAAAGITAADALDAFDEAARHGLVQLAPSGRGTHQFIHALVQEAVLHRLPAGRTAALHAGVARHLERDGHATPDELARHMWAARDIVGADAIPSQLQAADAAARVFAHQQAETHLRHALALARSSSSSDPSLELSVLLRLFRLIAIDRGWGDEAAAEVVDRAMQLVPSAGFDDDTAPLWWLLFNFLMDRNLTVSYVEVARTLLAHVQDEGSSAGPMSRAAVELMNVLASLAVDDRTRAREHLATARAHVEAPQAGSVAIADEQIHVSMLLIEGIFSAFSRDGEAHRSSITAAMALADADGRPFARAVARTMSAVSASYMRDAVLAESLASQALELDRRYGFGWLATVAGSVQNWANAALGGDLDDAAVAVEATLHQMVGDGRKSTQSTILLLLADIHRMAGRFDEARACLLRAREAPGPYQGLLVDEADRRRQELG